MGLSGEDIQGALDDKLKILNAATKKSVKSLLTADLLRSLFEKDALATALATIVKENDRRSSYIDFLATTYHRVHHIMQNEEGKFSEEFLEGNGHVKLDYIIEALEYMRTTVPFGGQVLMRSYEEQVHIDNFRNGNTFPSHYASGLTFIEKPLFENMEATWKLGGNRKKLSDEYCPTHITTRNQVTDLGRAVFTEFLEGKFPRKDCYELFSQEEQ